MAKKAKSRKGRGLVYDRSTGEFKERAPDFNAMEWWKRKLGIGNAPGEGALARRRKGVLDSRIDRDSN